MSAPIRLRVPATAGEVPALRHAATTFAAAHCDQDTQQAVALAVTEACSNVVRHAYPNGHGDLNLTGRLEDNHLIFEITDHGRWLTASRNPGLGMGVTLMRRLADTRITPKGPGTHVELRFPRRMTLA